MGREDDRGEVEHLLVEWNSLRVTEAYRRVHFTLLRDEVLSRWEQSGPHDRTAEHFVQHRRARAASALAEILDLEERSDASYVSCHAEMTTVARLSARERSRALAKIRGVVERALREEIRYRTTLVSTLHHEVNELSAFVDEKLGSPE